MEAGALLREHFEGRHLTGEGADGAGEGPVYLKADHELVLGVDLLSQKILVDGIARRFPGCGIYSEELPNWPECEGDRRLKFVIDPLDGTHNYHFGIPLWGISVALVDADNHPRAGMIHIPMIDLLLVNDGGGGPTRLHYRGGTLEARASAREVLDQVLVAYDNQFYRLGTEAFDIYQRLTRGAFTTRITGSAAFDTAMVAIGKFDARIWNNVEAYDVAGGFPIIRGAGGVVCGFDAGEDVSLFQRRIMICGNRRFAGRLSRLLLGAGPGKASARAKQDGARSRPSPKKKEVSAGGVSRPS
jgi:myo-inositol-1(or 4)-monophosphatase